MQKTITYEATSTGYMIYCNGQPIGGVRTQGTAKHTSDGRRKSWQNRMADTQMFQQQAKKTCAELEAGNGPEYLRQAIKAQRSQPTAP